MISETASAQALRRIQTLAGIRPTNIPHVHRETEAADEDQGGAVDRGCSIRTLPRRLAVDAAGVAVAVNPVNAPQRLTELALAVPDDPLSLTITIGKYFGAKPRKLTVSFMETTPADLRRRILQHLNAWNTCCGISFYATNGTGDVRISRAGSGYWSYLGTDIFLIPRNRPTMNLQGFTMNTSESEYRRVVRHEAGHTLGFPHEHMRKELVDRIDRQKAYDYFWQSQRWDQAQVDAQVLTPLEQSSIMGTAADQTSIMCYHLPGAITTDSQPIVGGNDINATDCAFAGKVYPRAGQAAAGQAGAAASHFQLDAGSDRDELDGISDFEDVASDWPEEEDVDVGALLEEA